MHLSSIFKRLAITFAGFVISTAALAFTTVQTSFEYSLGPRATIDKQILSANTQFLNIEQIAKPQIITAVQTPNLELDLEKAIQSVLEEFKRSSADVTIELEHSLVHLKGRYIAETLPSSLSNEYLATLPNPTGGQEFKCLSEALYFEARGESLRGQRAVAEVILNRVASQHYPDTICEVVNQGTGKKHQCQFSYTCDGIPEVINEPKTYLKVAKIARLMIDGLYEEGKLTKGALFYHTTAVRPRWALKMQRTARLGSHLFYRQFR